MDEKILIERLSYGSAGIGHTTSGKTVFVDKTSPGDVVEISIDEDKPRFSVGHVTTLIDAAPSRTTPPCPYYETCGGCPWQHIAYETQLQAKQDNVIDALIRTAHLDGSVAQNLVAPAKASEREKAYRNKLELSASYSDKEGFSLGFRKESSQSIVSIDSCIVAQEALEKSPKALRGALKYLQGTQNLGIFRVGVRNSLKTKDTEIALWTLPGAFPRKAVAQTLKSACKASSIVRVVADPGKARAIKQVEVLEGKGYWEEQLGNLRFKTSAPSFFQINTAQAEVLIEEVIAGLSLKPSDIVGDLYAGGGTFSLALAQTVDTVMAVESSSSSVKDLRRNAEINQLTIEVIGGDSARELPHLGKLDALVVDPPRSGLAEGVVESIAATKTKQIAYVSCDPITWARDVARFSNAGYHLRHVQPVDLFPQTYHVEIVSFFEPARSGIPG